MLDQYLTRLSSLGFTGAVLVSLDGRVLLEKGYGLANRSRQIPIGKDTVFCIGSNTKDLTLAAIFRLARDGKLGLDDSISRFFNQAPDDKRAITIRHLLKHRAGLESDFGGDFDPVSRDQIIARVLGSRLLSEPGKEFRYSNAGYSVLAAIIEIVSKRSYEEYVHENVLKPIGLTRIGFSIPKWESDRIAHGYLDGRDQGTVLDKPHAADGPYWNLRGNGGLYATVGDMYRLYDQLDAEVRRELVAPGTKRAMLVGGDGVNNFAYYVQRPEKLVIIAATTDAAFKAQGICPELARIALGSPAEMPPEIVEADRSELAKYAGEYRLAAGGVISVSADNGRLTLASTDQSILNQLAALDAAGGNRMSELSSRMASIIEASARGDFHPIHAAIGDVPFDQVEARQARLWKNRRDQRGEFIRVVSLGTLPRTGGGAISTMRIEFERGAELMEFLWEQGSIALIRPVEKPRGLEFAPAKGGGFVYFDARTGKSTRLLFKVDAAGGASSLAATSSQGSVEATRAKS